MDQVTEPVQMVGDELTQPVNPQPTPANTNHPLRLKLFLLLGILSFLAVLISGFFISQYLLKNKSEGSDSKINASLNSKPEEIVTKFYTAIKNKDKEGAKKFLSPNVNKDAFPSTFGDYNKPSIYYLDFEYKILESKLDLNSSRSIVDAEVIVQGQKLPTKMFLEKSSSGVWLIVDSETVTPKANYREFAGDEGSEDSKRVAFIISGPVQLYLKSPEGQYSGYNPTTKLLVDEIEDVNYAPNGVPKSLTVRELVGTWELNVIGIDSGKYIISAQTIDSESPTSGKIEGNAHKGSIDTYNISYPVEDNLPIVVKKVTN